MIIEQRSEQTNRTLGVCDTTDLLSDIKPNREGNYYLTDRQNKPEMLPDTRWADWDNNGRLLIATHSGRLQVHDITANGASSFGNATSMA